MNIGLLITQVLRISVPYLFAASGGVVAERAGVISLTLEGFMLTGAFTATLGAYYTGNPWMGVLAGIAGGIAIIRARQSRQRMERFAAATLETLLNAIDANDRDTGAQERAADFILSLLLERDGDDDGYRCDGE